MGKIRFQIWGVVFAALLAAPGSAQIPNHPILTEVYTDPRGTNDGPVGRDVGNQHQEYIELYLPPAANLHPSLNKDAVRLAIYEVEGDLSSSGYALVNYRIDLPTFDLDGGSAAPVVNRPSSGVVVLGWVDYVGNPPTGLAGTPSTRVALINGGVTSTSGFTFVPLNGSQFTGTTNFPVPTAISLINMPNEAGSGIIQNGSGAYLLVNRDSAGYVLLYDDDDAAHVPPIENADPDLAQGTVLATSALLDGFAGNDDSLFDVLQQPYPLGTGVDLDGVLPLGGPFSGLLAQVPESMADIRLGAFANGYARRFVDVAKTTEVGTTADDDPVQDALDAYRAVLNDGPFYPTPGRVALTTTPPELSVAAAALNTFDVLAATTTDVGVVSANVGGNYAINMSATSGASSNASVATFSAGPGALGVGGQQVGFPGLRVTGGASAANGATATATATVTATNSVGGQPAVINPNQMTTVTARVLNPAQGLSSGGQPFQATVFLAVQPVAANGATANEFRTTALGGHVAANLGGTVLDTRGLGGVLVNAGTNLNDGPLMQSLLRDFPDPGAYLNWPGPPGDLNLYQTVVQSAEVQSGAATYVDVVDSGSQSVRAIRLNCPDTQVYGGSFAPPERLYFANPIGAVGSPGSTLNNVTSTRTFELAIFETNTRDDSTLEDGATDDFGLIVEVAAVEPGSPVVVGELVFLSFTGGLQGADVDTLNAQGNVGTIIYLDLDNLHTVLGITTIESIFVVDAGGNGNEVDVVEVFSLNPAGGFLVASNPPSEDSLPRSNRNTIRATFSSDISAPGPGQILVQPMLPSGAFGADLSAGFAFTVENNAQSQPRILKILDVDPPNLLHRQWYSIRSVGAWTGGGIFEVQYQVQVGDANGDNAVLNFDAGVINGGIPNLSAADQDRRDIDGDATILNDDVSIMNVRIPSFPVAKPTGH